MSERVEDFDVRVQSVTPVSYEGQRAYYVVQFLTGGWALIAADDMSTPLIGYSPEGTYRMDGQPENVSGMMEVYGRQVVRNARLSGSRHSGWDEAERPAAARAQAAASNKINPLITVNWNQSGSYNKYCPSDANGRALVGCVAVGMAQAMSVAQWPARPVGEFSYVSDNYGYQYINYDEEPAYNWSAILSGADGYDHVARLLWHCGVAVKMEYGRDGSGTQSSYIAAALQRNFQYPPSVKYYNRNNYGGDWQELILNELQEGRAVAYNGHDPVKNYGHCFNLDGYDGQWFHVNWGWGGQNNGYFGLDGLRDAKMDMDYTEGQGVLVGVRAPSEKPSNIELSAYSVAAGKPKGTYVADVIVESEATLPVYEYKLAGKYNPITHKQLAAKFYVEDNKLYTSESLNVGTQTVTITATNISNKGSVERTFTINVVDASAISDIDTDGQEVVRQWYYTSSGQQTDAPRKGLNIVRRKMADGSVKSIKVFQP